MKKTKLIIPLITSLSSVIVPITVTSCNKNNFKANWLGDFVEIWAGEHKYENTIDALKKQDKTLSADETVDLYLDSIKNNPAILKDDICKSYSLVYRSNKTDFGEGFKKYELNIAKNNIKIDKEKDTIQLIFGAHIQANQLGRIYESNPIYKIYKNVDIDFQIQFENPIHVSYRGKSDGTFFDNTKDGNGVAFLLEPVLSQDKKDPKYKIKFDGSFTQERVDSKDQKDPIVINVENKSFNGTLPATTGEDAQQKTALHDLIQEYFCSFTKYLNKNVNKTNWNFLISNYLSQQTTQDYIVNEPAWNFREGLDLEIPFEIDTAKKQTSIDVPFRITNQENFVCRKYNGDQLTCKDIRESSTTYLGSSLNATFGEINSNGESICHISWDDAQIPSTVQEIKLNLAAHLETQSNRSADNDFVIKLHFPTKKK